MGVGYFYSYLNLVSSPTVHVRRAGLSPLPCLTGVLGSMRGRSGLLRRSRLWGYAGTVESLPDQREHDPTALQVDSSERHKARPILRPTLIAKTSGTTQFM